MSKKAIKGKERKEIKKISEGKREKNPYAPGPCRGLPYTLNLRAVSSTAADATRIRGGEGEGRAGSWGQREGKKILVG